MEWITDRPPELKEATNEGDVWVYDVEADEYLIRNYEEVNEGQPWMEIPPPPSYVKPKLQRYIVVPGKRDDRFLELQECEAAFDSAVCMSDDVKHIEEINAGLLEALEEIITQTDGRNHYVIGHDRAYAIARAAIAKAKGDHQ